MKTNTIIEYGAVDVTAKQDSSINVSDKQTFSDIIKLKRSNLAERKYSTLEKNFFVLDGKAENMGSSVDVAWWSNQMSDSNGDFDTPLVMTITFTEVHTSIGLTFKFSKYAYCNNMKIQYYNSSDTLILEETYAPDNYEYFCEDTAENYTKIVVTFYSTNIPYRYLKLYKILYGKAILFEGDSLISANILEQVNLISDELSINTLDFTVYSDDDRFNILNPQGVYATLQQKQELNVYEEKNDEIYNMGKFYIDSWESQNDNKMEFKGIDIVGILDKTTFDGGMYTNITVEDLIASIFQSAGLDSTYYELQNELKNIAINGYIPQCTHREALQQVLFTIGAIANCARSDIIEIYEMEESLSPEEISNSNILKGSRNIEQGDIVTGVSIETHSYSQSTEKVKLYTGQLGVGTYKINFEKPVYNITCTGATIQSSNANFATIVVPTAGEILLEGYEYVDNVQDVLIENSNLVGNEVPNVLKISSVYLINDDNVQTIGQRILEYYDNKFKTEFDLILNDEKAGDNVTVDERYGNAINGFITELDIDLTRGYIAKCKILGEVDNG